MRYSISIVVFNQIEYTKKCIESILKFSKDYELLLWDNGSTDGTKEYFVQLCKEHKNITATTVPENIGYSTPQNHNAKKATGEYFVALNNDLTVCQDWLEKLSAPFEDPKVAIVGLFGEPSTLKADGWGSFGPQLDYIDGACFMMKKTLIDKYGLFDDVTFKFAYSEDADLSLRMKSLGYKIKKVKLEIIHEGAVTSRSLDRKTTDMALKYSIDNRKELVDKWGMNGFFFGAYFDYKYEKKQEEVPVL